MHDFKNFPELTNNQLRFYYFESPHKQITRDFRATVTKVIDGDTIRVECDFRDFDFPIRLLDIAAPEIKEGGRESQQWLESKILNEEIDVVINPKIRVGKWGRLLGQIIFQGMNMNDWLVRDGHAVAWEDRDKGIFNFKKAMEKIWA